MTSSNYNGLGKLITKVLIFCTYLMTWNKNPFYSAERINKKPDVVDNEYLSWFYDISYHS